MRVLIIGGTGLIGRAVAANLIAGGHSVLVTSRAPAKARGMPANVELVQWDTHSPDPLAPALEATNVVINLVGENLGDGRWSAARKQRIVDSRVESGRNLSAAIQAAATKPQVLIQSSAVGYYGPHGNEVITESAPPGADFPAHVCFQWESATAPVERLGVRRAIIRTGLVLSTEGGALPQILLPFKSFVGGKVGSGRQYWPWIHIEDEVRAIRFLIDTPAATGPFNLTAPNPVTAADFAKTVGTVMKRPAFLPAPSIAFKLAFGEMSTILLGGQAAIPQRLEALGFQFTFSSLEAALTDLLA